MESLGKKLMLGGSMAAMVAAITATAHAQEQAPSTEAVTVSASRINIQGYEAPTPVTVIGAAQLQRDAKVDIGDAIRELPAVGNKKYPGIVQDYEKTFQTLKALPVDVFLGAHGDYYGMEAKYAKLKPGSANPFIDPEGYRAYIANREAAYRKELAKQKADGKL